MIKFDLEHLGLDKNRYIIAGSGVLEAKGICESDDIDVLVTDEYWQELKNSLGWEITVLPDGKHALTHQDVEVFTHYGTNGQLYDQVYPGTELINGVRFTSLKQVLNWKINKKRTKDLIHIKKIRDYLRQS